MAAEGQEVDKLVQAQSAATARTAALRNADGLRTCRTQRFYSCADRVRDAPRGVTSRPAALSRAAAKDHTGDSPRRREFR